MGRTFKTETLNWNGSVYSSNTTVFDGADRTIFARQFEGAAILNNPHQTTTQTYDGFGRLKTQHKPEQDAGTNTVYNYNPDNSISSMVDARGAITNYTYNVGTGQVIDISYVSPNANIPVTPSVYYAYNNLGMKTQMVDGLGYTDYVYNNLGQMTSETRKFNDVLPNAPQANSSFKLEYTYTLNGQMKSLKDPYGQQINYGFDKVGRLNNVSGSTAFAGVTNYATTPKYNARGILTHLNYGNGVEMNITNFNNKLQATNFEVKKDTTQIIKKNYEFYDDSSLKYSQDVVDAKFDRSYKYDFASRIMEAKTGAEARGGTVPMENQAASLPYRQSYNYNVYNQLTQRNNRHWGIEYWFNQNNNLNYTYQNNRITNINNAYDADGRVWHSGEDGSDATYDAKGEMTRMLTPESSDIYRNYDGNGREAKRKIKRWIIDENEVGSWSPFEEKTYFIRSSVLGNETVSEVGPSGEKQKTYITAGGAKLATQTGHINYERVYFNHQDASGASIRATREDGSLHNDYSSDDSPAELDPMGGNMGISTPYITIIQQQPDPENWNYLYNESPMYVNGQRVSYTIDGLSVSQSYFQMVIESGRIGGQFGLLYMAAQASAQRVKIGSWWRTTTYNTVDPNDAANITSHTAMTKLNDVFADFSWSASVSLVGEKGGNPIKHPPGQSPIAPQPPLTIHDEVRRFLNTNKPCEDLINKILKQLSSDTGIKLEGDIRYFIDQLEKNGVTEVFNVGKDENGNWIQGGGGIRGPNYGEAGWGIYFSRQVERTDFPNSRSAFQTYLGELIHAVGRRNNATIFSDDNGVRALNNLGLSMSLDAYTNLPENANRLEKKVGTGEVYLPFGGSRLFHDTITKLCKPGTSR